MMVSEIVERMTRWGIEQERVMSIRITGCPNVAAHDRIAGISRHRRRRIPGYYSIYVGGDFEGTRLNEVVAERIRLGEVADVLDPLFGVVFAAEREPGESFGDFCQRYSVARLREVVAEARDKPRAAAD